MKKLLFKVIVLTALVAVVLIILNSLYVRTQGYKNMIAEQGTGKLKNVPGDLAVVNFGDSHAESAFGYKGTGIRGFNFGLGGQDFYYNYQLARHFQDQFANGCIVLIPVSYFSFGLNQHEESSLTYDSRYYGILPYGDIRGHNLLDYVKFHWCPIIFGGEDLKWLLRDEAPTHQANSQPPNKNYSEKSLRFIGRKWANIHNQFLNQSNSVYDFNKAYLDKLVSFCQKEGWRPVLMTTPYTDYYTSNFSKAFLDDFRARVYKVSKKYGIPFLDFSHDSTFSGDIDLFRGSTYTDGDSDHLNMLGRQRFTKVVIDKLKSMGMLPESSRK